MLLFTCGILSIGPASLATSAEDVPTSLAQYQTERVEIQPTLVEAFQFQKPRHEPRGIKAAFALSCPSVPKANWVTDAYFSAALDEAIGSHWKIVDFRAFEVGNRNAEVRQIPTYYVVPSACNSYCRGRIRYVVADLDAKRKYRVEYLLWPTRPESDQESALARLRSETDESLNVNVHFEFAESFSDAHHPLASDTGAGE